MTLGGPILKVYSEEFVSQLTPSERTDFEWRQVTPTKRRKRLFFEAIARTPPVPWVSALGRDTYYSLCDECGWTWVIPRMSGKLPVFMMSAASLPSPVPTLLPFGERIGFSLMATPARWAELAGTPGAKGVKATVVSVIAETAVERAPVYQPRARQGWKLRP
jgi:hypothetical protein